MIDYLQQLLDESAEALYSAQRIAGAVLASASALQLESQQLSEASAQADPGGAKEGRAAEWTDSLQKIVSALPNDHARDWERWTGKTTPDDTILPMHQGVERDHTLPLLHALSGAEEMERTVKTRQLTMNEVQGHARTLEAEINASDALTRGWSPMGSPSRTQAGESQEAAQLVDRAFRRDSRRYDGGFYLY